MKPAWLNYHHLLYFKIVAQEGGIAKAAKKLRLGQPTLSTQIKQFEHALGHKLFDRSKRHLQLTESGRLILDYANEIFSLGEEMVDVLNDYRPAAKIELHIGAMDTVPKHLILKIFEAARNTFDCVVSIAEGHGDELLRELKSHRLDLVIAGHAPSVGQAAGFYAKNIAKMPVMICASKKYAHLKKGFPKSLSGQPFVMPSFQSRLRHEVEHHFKLNDIQVHTIAEVQDTSLQKLMGIHGHGIIPVAMPAVEELVDAKELMVLGALENVYDELWMIAAHRRIQNPVAAAIVKSFKLS